MKPSGNSTFLKFATAFVVIIGLAFGVMGWAYSNYEEEVDPSVNIAQPEN